MEIVKGKNEEIGTKIAMHIAASNPLAIDKDGIDKKIVDKELEIIKQKLLIQENLLKWLKKFLKEKYQNF